MCVQRLPIITKAKTDLEIAYEELQEKLEWEHSALSEDEVQWDTIMQRKEKIKDCLLYTSPSPRDLSTSRMPSSA